eukprot:jgi/Mesvir1/22674/Mv14102-RA.3
MAPSAICHYFSNFFNYHSLCCPFVQVEADFGEVAIGRVAPVDSGLWWIQLLQFYTHVSGDNMAFEPEFQKGVRLILKLCLSDYFDMFPTMLTSDGCCMIDRRMSIDGHPIEIQALLYGALRSAEKILDQRDPENAALLRILGKRICALRSHIREFYWVDLATLNYIYRFKTEEYSDDAINVYNVYPESIPDWTMDWMPSRGGYLIGNLGPARMDFRFFALGNLWAIVSNLTTPEQSAMIMCTIEERWADLVGEMPMKIQFPALEGAEWRIMTGSDPKNTPWSYHNSGSWPMLLWPLVAACVRTGRIDLADRAVRIAEARLSRDKWPEYYDGRSGRLLGKQARLYQTWTVAGLIAARMLLDHPERIKMFGFEEVTSHRPRQALQSTLKKRPKKNEEAPLNGQTAATSRSSENGTIRANAGSNSGYYSSDNSSASQRTAPDDLNRPSRGGLPLTGRAAQSEQAPTTGDALRRSGSSVDEEESGDYSCGDSAEMRQLAYAAGLAHRFTAAAMTGVMLGEPPGPKGVSLVQGLDGASQPSAPPPPAAAQTDPLALFADQPQSGTALSQNESRNGRNSSSTQQQESARVGRGGAHASLHSGFSAGLSVSRGMAGPGPCGSHPISSTSYQGVMQANGWHGKATLRQVLLGGRSRYHGALLSVNGSAQVGHPAHSCHQSCTSMGSMRGVCLDMGKASAVMRGHGPCMVR